MSIELKLLPDATDKARMMLGGRPPRLTLQNNTLTLHGFGNNDFTLDGTVDVLAEPDDSGSSVSLRVVHNKKRTLSMYGTSKRLGTCAATPEFLEFWSALCDAMPVPAAAKSWTEPGGIRGQELHIDLRTSNLVFPALAAIFSMVIIGMGVFTLLQSDGVFKIKHFLVAGFLLWWSGKKLIEGLTSLVRMPDGRWQRKTPLGRKFVPTPQLIFGRMVGRRGREEGVGAWISSGWAQRQVAGVNAYSKSGSEQMWLAAPQLEGWAHRMGLGIERNAYFAPIGFGRGGADDGSEAPEGNSN